MLLVTPAPARFGLWFALTLALPAAFAAAWAWLVPGGVITRAEAGERRAAEQALATAASALDEALRAFAATVPVPLELDDQRRVRGPFRASAFTVAEPVASIAEQAASSRLAAGNEQDALPFFAHAADEGGLTPTGWIQYGNSLAASDPHAALALLSRAQKAHADACCGPLPFAVVTLLAAARWAGRAQLPQPADRGEQLLLAVRRVPADAVATVLDEFVIHGGIADAERVLAVRAAAATARAMWASNAIVAAVTQPGPEGSVVVPIAADRCAVVPASAVARARALAEQAAVTAEPGLAVAGAATATARAVATRDEPALGETWSALPVATPTSALLAITARTSLALGAIVLVLGNLLLWRLTRRELQLVRLRADFVDVVSHELRTPLTALSLKAEMLAQGDVPAERRTHYLQALHADVRRLTDQVERILDFGRLAKGAPLCIVAVPARTVLARGLREGRPALRMVKQQLTIDAPRTLPSIAGDLEVLGRALRNLLENAAKYAPPGSTVAVRAFAEGDRVVVEVADEGPGVPPGDRRSIFEPFVRGSTNSPGTPGSGLGLALVAAAARGHGGSVAVHERDGGGAMFTLQLPIARGWAS